MSSTLKLKHCVAALILILSGWMAAAQTRTVKGSVSDAQGPLPGVSVLVKGTTNGTSTDLDGNFSLSVPDDAVLVFSYIGYRTEELKPGKSGTVKLIMEADATLLDELVVVGYGTQAKSHLTGSISKIGGESLIDRPVSDVTTALQGQIAGLSINNNTSEVGVTPTIRVRGTGSISADSAPLVIVDGFPDAQGLANVTDRQRNEIKTDGKSPAALVAQEGETLRMSWKFCLPEGMKTTTNFCHIHQLKGIDNSDGTADVSMPLITFTCRSLSSGKQQLQVIHVGRTEDNTGNEYLAKADLADFLGQWVSVSETVTFAGDGSYHLVIYRMSDGKQLMKVDKEHVDLWRSGTTGLRPKWGIYRSFGQNRSLAGQLRDEILHFADFYIEKLQQ